MKQTYKTSLVSLVAVSSLLLLAGCSTTSAPAGFKVNTTTSNSAPSGDPANNTSTTTTTTTNSANAVNTTGSNSGGAPSATNTIGAAATGNSTGSTVASGSVTVSTTGANADTSGTLATQFPAIVRMAMNELPTSARAFADAPTMYPVPASGGNQLFYRTGIFSGPTMLSPRRQLAYSVWFNDKAGATLAQFEGARYDTSSNARDAILGGFGDVFGVNGQSSPITLNTGLAASAIADTTNDLSHVLWTEGRWKIDVSAVDTTTPDLAVANEVVAYLHTHFLPVPETLGEISVSVNDSHITMMMIWQKSNTVFNVTTNPATKNPIETGLAMAISMKPYQ